MLTPTRSAIDYDDLIQESPEFGFRIHHQLYKDEEIFQQEMERIFHKGWVYVGHETEIPNPGDFQVRLIGQKPVILCRGKDNQIRVFENKCRHRGNTVCQEQRGNKKFFRCAYHGWIFANTGELLEITHPSGFGNRLPGKDYGLVQAPRMGSHRGFLFASLAKQGIDFTDYLGRAADYIDRYCDLAPDGAISLSPGRHGIRHHGNWKFQLENLTDAYHAEFVHATALAAFAANSSRDGAGEFSDRGDLEDPLITMRDLGGGHAVLDNFASNRRAGEKLQWTGSTGTLLPEVIEKVGQRENSLERAKWLAYGGPSHIMVFPNLMILWDAVRTIQPVSLTESIIYYHPALLQGASQAVNTARIMSHQAGFGPAGFLAADDMEMFERNQIGVANDSDPWLYLNRGYDSQRMEEDDFGVEALTSQNLDETTQRGIWRHYKKIMSVG